MSENDDVPKLLEAADETYETIGETFAVIDYVIRYAKNRWGLSGDAGDNSQHLWPVYFDVDFVDKKRAPNGYRTYCPEGSDTLWLLVANHDFSAEQQEELRLYYHQQFAPVLGECQRRSVTGLWRLVQKKQRDEILAHLKAIGALSPEAERQVFEEIASAKRREAGTKPETSVELDDA
jgi:hypothetical protein